MLIKHLEVPSGFLRVIVVSGMLVFAASPMTFFLTVIFVIFKIMKSQGIDIKKALT